MEALLVLFVPIFLLWFGLTMIQGRPFTPDVVLKSANRQLSKLLKWLWKEKPQRGGVGRPRRPPNRYRR